MIVVAAALLGLLGCSVPGGGVPTEPAATPAASPPAASPPAATPAGIVRPLGAAAESVVVDPLTRTAAVALRTPDRVLLLDLDHPELPARTLALPAPAGRLGLAAPGGPLLVPTTSADQVLAVPLPAAAPVVTVGVPGHPVAATADGRTLLVAVASGAVDVVEDSRVARAIDGLSGASQVLVSGGTVTVLDREQSALRVVDPAAGTTGESLRVGDGATNAVPDGYGRVIVVDSLGAALLAVGLRPLLLRQRFPVPGSPYGLAYDTRRHVAWITLTATNQLLGFDVAGGEPVLHFRFATVRQPDSVAVDDASGAVLVASAAGEGLQVVQP